MRVLMTADAVGGVWTYSLALARGLSKHGCIVDLAVMGPSPSADQLADAAEIRVLHRPFLLEWMENPWADVDAAGVWLLEVERELRPDLIHLNGYSHAVVPFTAPTIIAAHSCVASWWRAVHGEAAPAKWDPYRSRVVAGLNAADATVAISHAMSRALEKEYRRAADFVIYNGLDGPELKTAKDLPGEASRHLAVFCAGRFWDAAKNLQVLERAASLIEADIFAAGDGWDGKDIWALGRLNRKTMGRWYSRCAVFCHPALYEPFGLAPLEAALHGCALVLSDIPSLREIWGKCALFADPHDPISIGNCVNQLLNSRELRERNCARALGRAQRYSLARQCRDYLDIYQSVIKRSGSERAIPVA